MNRLLLSLAAVVVAAGVYVEYLAHAERPAPVVQADPREAVLPTDAQPQTIPPRSAFRVDVTRLIPKLDAVAADDRGNQIADWVVYGILAEVGLGTEDLRAATFDIAPLRLASLEGVLDFNYSPGRRIALTSGEVWLVYDEHDARSRATLARLADSVRMERGDDLPSSFGVFRYRSALDEGVIYVEREADIPTDALFSQEYGYVEAIVGNSSEDLKDWLARVDDLVHVRRLDDGWVRLGGRRLDDERTLGATIDDVAALYQAHVTLRNHQEAFEQHLAAVAEPLAKAFGDLIDEYNANVLLYNVYNSDLDLVAFGNKIRRIEDLLGSQVLNTASSDFSSINAQLEAVEALEDPVQRRIQELQQEQQETYLAALRAGEVPPAEPGFSLDPQWNTEGLLADLRLLRDHPARLVRAAHDYLGRAITRQDHPLALRRQEMTATQVAVMFSYAGDLDEYRIDEEHRAYITDMLVDLESKSGRELEDGAILPFLQLLERVKQGDSIDDIRLLRLLQEVESRNRAQCARYDGPLQGTRVGMNLFYTDLLAKLWASVDYYGVAPIEEIRGFLTGPQSGYLLEASYWQENWQFPATRLWFGIKDEGFKSNANGDALAFAHIAARVYAAGSNPLVPGVEEAPNEANRRVFDWWNRHYDRVADYEQQYHLQNQIMKWSVITGWLAEEGYLPSLTEVPVQHNHRFDSWYASQPHLKFKHDVRFLPTSDWLGNTECVEILRSYKHPHAGKFHSYIEGGVSLGSGSTVNAAAKVGDDLSPALRRPGVDYEMTRPGKISNVKGTSFELPPAANDNVLVRATMPEGARLRAGGTTFDFAKLETRITLELRGGTIALNTEAASLGRLRWQADADGVRLAWLDGEAEITREALNGVAASLQRTASRGDNMLASHLAADSALLPRTGHYIVHRPGKAVEVVASAGSGGHFGGPPPIRGPPAALPGDDGWVPPEGASGGRVPFVIHIFEDSRRVKQPPKVAQPFASASASNDIGVMAGMPPMELEAALLKTKQVEEIMDQMPWQRLSPLTRGVDDAPSDVARVFTTAEPSPEARVVTLSTNHPDLPTVEARWIEGALFLKRPKDTRASRAFDDVVVDEGITTASLQKLGEVLRSDPNLKTLDFGRQVGERYGYEAAYWAESGRYDALTGVLRAAAEQGQLDAAVAALERNAALRMSEGLVFGRETAAGRRLAGWASSAAPEPRLARAIHHKEQGQLDDVLADLRTLEVAKTLDDPAWQGVFRAGYGDDAVAYLRLRQNAYKKGVPEEQASNVRLERRGLRLVTEVDLDALARRPRQLTDNEKRRLIFEIEKTPPERVYVQDRSLLATLDWDGAPGASLSAAARDPRVDWAVLDLDDFADFRPTMLVDAQGNRYVARTISEPRANPRPLPPPPSPPKSCEEGADDPSCQSNWSSRQRVYLLAAACADTEENAEGQAACIQNRPGQRTRKAVPE